MSKSNRSGNFKRVGVVIIIDETIVGSLVAANVGLSIKIIIEIAMDIKMVWLDGADNGYMRGFIEVPELETGEFVNDYRGGLKLIENIEGGDADIADKMSVEVLGVEESFNKGADSAFALGGGNTDNRAGTVIEEIFGNAALVF